MYWSEENPCPVGFMSRWCQNLIFPYSSVNVLFFFLWIILTASLGKKHYASLFSVFPFVLFQFGLAYVWTFHRVEITAASIALASHHLFPVGPKLWHYSLHPEYTDLSSSWLIKLAPSSRYLLLILFRIALASSFCDWLILIFQVSSLEKSFLSLFI